jgi:hypothetical protein
MLGDHLNRRCVVVAAVEGFLEDREVRRQASETVDVQEALSSPPAIRLRRMKSSQTDSP